MKYLISQNSANQQFVELVGGKSNQLYQLRFLGLTIPAWVSVSSNFLASVLSEIRLEDIDESKIEAYVCERIKVSDEYYALKEEVVHFLMAYPNSYFAVRSSILEEDGKGFSYAGLMHSYLYQKEIDQIMHSICLVLASAFSSQAIMFRTKSNLGVTTKASVMIQLMIDSDVSGVCFTVDPQSGRFDKSLINANYGLCESIVASLSACDEYGITDNLLIEKKINCKAEYSEFDTDKKCVALKGQVQDLQLTACLTDDQILEVYQAGQLISKNKNYPQDIEWTIKDNQLYILQSRAITRVVFDKDENTIFWDNSNIQESYYGVTTPLTFSFIQEAYKTVYQQTMQVMGLSDKKIDAYQSVLNNLLGCVHGQVYYNINNWYKGLMVLPGFNKNKRDMEEMMGLSHSVDFIEDKKFSSFEKMVKFPGLIKTYIHLILMFMRLKKLSQSFNDHFKKVYEQYQNDSLKKMSFSELVDLTHTLKRELLENWSTPIINDFYVMMKNGKLTDYFKKHNVKNPQQLKSLLIFNHEQDIESVKPTKAVIEISELINKNETIKNWFLNNNPVDVVSGLSLYPSVYVKFNDFIHKYGDRSIGELKLETKTYRQKPEMLVDLIINYLSMEPVEFKSDTLSDDVLEEYGLQINKSFNKKLEKLKDSIGQRENMRFQRTRLFGLYREIFLEIGKRLSLLGLIQTVDDIFYLKWSEITNLNKHTIYDEDLKILIDGRKKQAKIFEGMNPQDHFKSSSAGFVQSEATVLCDKNTIYKGLGCFPGVVTGQVKKVEDHRDVSDLQGKILVAKRTDPGWTPLFPTCSAVIVERGSALSHSAIIARELGLVAIVNIENICQILQDGDWVEVDGSTGIVKKLNLEDLNKV